MESTFPFSAQVTQDQDRTLCTFGGTLTHNSYESFRPVLDAVRDHGGGPFVLDLAELRFLDSNGLGMLLILQESARERGHRIHMVNVPPRVERVLRQTNTRQMFNQ